MAGWLAGWLAGYLCPLARSTLSAPLLYVCSQTRPDKAAADQPGCGPRARMGEGVDVLKHCSAVAAWYQWHSEVGELKLLCLTMPLWLV